MDSPLLEALEALEADLASGPADLEDWEARLTALELKAGEAQPRLWALRAKGHLLAGDAPAALTGFERALQLDPTVIPWQINAASVRLVLGDAAGARTVLRPLAVAAAQEPTPSWAVTVWNNLARAELELGQHEEALMALEAVLRLAEDPGRLDPWLALVEDWQQAGQPELAERMLQLVRQFGSEAQRQRWLPALANQLLAQGRAEEAATLYGELLWPSASTS